MGYIVLQEIKPEEYFLIDGQQRLATLSLLILATIKYLQDLKNQSHNVAELEKRIQTARDQFIQISTIGSVTPRTRLELNRNNDLVYRQELVPLEISKGRRSDLDSVKLMRAAFDFFFRKISELASTCTSDKEDFLGNFIQNKVSNGLYCTVITVKDELDAQKVFETLNARGVQLSSADLIKNRVFSNLKNSPEHDIDYAEKIWHSIIDEIRNLDLNGFIRTWWNSQKETKRSSELFYAIRKEITQAEDTMQMLSEMSRHAELYVALSEYDHEFWPRYYSGGLNEIKSYIKALRTMELSQFKPLLFAAYRKFTPKEFIKTLKLIVITSFRYNTISGKNPNEMEEIYCALAQDVESLIVIDSDQIKQRLKSVYVNDSEFIEAYKYKSISYKRRKTFVTYMLYMLEQQAAGIKDPLKTPDWIELTTSIEHIKPQTEAKNMIEKREFERLGNYTLLAIEDNSKLGSKPYAERLPVYAQSQYYITREIAKKYPVWDEAAIDARQADMARAAAQIWRLDFDR